MPKTETFNRSEVLEKVTNLFWEKGYSATSMQDIVDSSGLNRSSIYNSFGDKHQLFTEAITYYQQHVQSSSFAGADVLKPKDIIRNLFEGVLNSLADKENHKGCFLTNSTAELASQDQGIHTLLLKNMADLRAVLEDLLKRGKELGDFEADLDVNKTALYLFSSLQGIRLTGMLVDSKADMKALVESTLANI